MTHHPDPAADAPIGAGTHDIIAAAWLRGELPRHPDFDPAGYVADDALRRAVNAALALGLPLLLTGEPGSGKTQLAYRLAWELDKGGDDKPLRFDTKSTSLAADLFYQFDSVRHFGASQLAVALHQEPPHESESIVYRALGLAVLRSRSWDHNQTLVSQRQAEVDGLRNAGPRRSVVLIDEIDKAPRDFPNDLLSQLERRYSFDIPELKHWGVEIDPLLRPIIVITSNSERQLPEAFLRRCVFHHLALPSRPEQREQWIERILRVHFGADEQQQMAEQPATRDAIAAFWSLRDRGSLNKPPSTPELIDWLRSLRPAGLDLRLPLAEQREALRGTLGVLLKTADDLVQGMTHFGAAASAR